MLQNYDLNSELMAFSKTFDTAREDKAVNVRGEFITKYPLEKIKNLTLDEYVIGKGTSSFCAYVEAKTKSWASVQGATSSKFGIYFGKTKYDATMKYRVTKRFGDNTDEGFKKIKEALLGLINSGKSKNFQEIDENPLSQMFKAKILSLYFPKVYLNICSADHLEYLALELGIPEQEFISKYQNLLIEKKLSNEISRNWSNPKFMAFLYDKYMPKKSENPELKTNKKKRKKTNRKVNFEDINANRERIGIISEEYAFKWERNRLIGLGYEDLANNIKDRRDHPSYGYDYLSYESPKQKRYIEVKSVGRDRQEKCHRFFLSENEYKTSLSNDYRESYYFYLVLFDKDGQPCDVIAKRAKEFYLKSERSSCAYILRFDVQDC